MNYLVPRPWIRRSLLAPLAVVLLSGLLLFTWFGALAAVPSGLGTGGAAGAGLGELVNPSDLTAMLVPTSTDTLVRQPILQEATPTPTQEPTVTQSPTETPTPTPTATATQPADSVLPGPAAPAATDVPFDLYITKNQIPSTFKVGTGNIYVITVNRSNTSTIDQTVIVEDSLPNGLTWTPVDVGDWECTTTSTSVLVSCYYTEIDPDAFDQLRFQVNVPDDVTVFSFTNTATLKINDANLTNNESAITTTIDSLDLDISKTASPTNIITGTISYSLVITNTGPVAGRGVYVEESIPAELEFIGFEPATETFAVNALGTIGTWTIGDMPKDTLKQITLKFRPRTTAIGKKITNTATVKYGNFNDYDTSNNSASADVVVGGMQISKKTYPTSVQVGEPITFTFTITNPGTTQLSSVTLKDALNSHLSVKKIYAGGVSSRTYTNNFGTLAGGATRTVNLVVAGNTSISNTETLTNVATLSWVNAGTTIAIKSNETQFTINPGGSLQVGKTDGISAVDPGTTISYTVSLTNTGNRSVSSIIITDTMGGYLSPVSVNPGSVGTGSCSDTNNFCVVKLNEALTAGAKISFRVSGKVASGTPAGAVIPNTVRATGIDDQNNRVSSQYTDYDTANELEQYSMSVIESVNPRQARVNDSITFRILVANNGTTTVNNVHVTSELPDVLDLTSVTTSKGTGTMNTSARTLDVNLGSMIADEEARIVVVTKVNSTATSIASYRTKSRVTWTGGKLNSNEVRFRVLPSATLPGTGWAPRSLAASQAGQVAAAGGVYRLLIGLVLLGGAGLAFLGMLLLGYGIYMRARHPLHAGPYTGGGLALIVLGLFAGLAGMAMFGLIPSGPQQPDLVMLSGIKPQAATQEAQAPRPVRTRRPTATPGSDAMGNEYLAGEYQPTPTPESLPYYPVPSPTIVVTEGPQGIEPDSSEVTRLVIPNMGLDTEVKYVPFNGDTWLIGGLKQEIAWMGDTSWPGLGGNTGLAGHVDLANGDAGPFWNLSALKVGDQVTLYTQKNRYVYTVSENKTVYDYETTVLDQTNDATITMITCAGWDAELETYLQRLIVYAKLTEVHTLGN